MRSLRSRLILGFAITALVPLALSMFLLSRRIEDEVRAQAGERLGAVLGRIEAGLALDGERMTGKLEILARDPLLKRLYLLRPAGRELAESLEEKRFLLGLDFLHVTDTSGVVIADAARAEPARGDRPGLDARALPRHGGPGARIEAPPGSDGLVMAASAPIRYEGNTVGVLRGGLALDGAFLDRLRSASGAELVLTNGGRPLATTLAPGTDVAVDAAMDRAASAPTAGGAQRVTLAGASYWARGFPLRFEAAPGGAGASPATGDPVPPRITGLIPTAAADRTIAALQLTSLLLGALGLAVAVALGVLWSAQISRPVERLAAAAQRIARGEWDEPVRVRSVGELQALVTAFERMRADLGDYRSRLVTSERQAAWGQMARMVAHEIKNPLTPIAVSVADLKRSFERDRADFPAILDQAVRTIGAEVDALKHILQEFSDFARLPAPAPAPCRLAELMADLASLYAREIEALRLELAPAADITFTADRGQMRQALVNLIQNALDATAAGGRVVVSSRVEARTLEIAVSDDGPGMSPERKAELFVPGSTTKAHGSGLGLVIVQRIVSEHGGSIAAETAPGRGTTFRIRLPPEALRD